MLMKIILYQKLVRLKQSILKAKVELNESVGAWEQVFVPVMVPDHTKLTYTGINIRGVSRARTG